MKVRTVRAVNTSCSLCAHNILYSCFIFFCFTFSIFHSNIYSLTFFPILTFFIYFLLFFSLYFLCRILRTRVHAFWRLMWLCHVWLGISATCRFHNFNENSWRFWCSESHLEDRYVLTSWTMKNYWICLFLIVENSGMVLMRVIMILIAVIFLW